VTLQLLCAVGLAVASATLMTGPGPRVRPDPGRRTMTGRTPQPVASVAPLALLAVVAAFAVDGTDLVLALILIAVAGGVVRMWRRSRRRAQAERRRSVVVEVAEALAGELAAGVPPVSALTRAAELWPELAGVAAAARLDADVPDALRAVAALPGAEGLADVASAWQVSQRSGATLAGTLTQVVRSARARQGAAHLVRVELSSAQATARLVAVLPLGTLAMASGVGAAPWSFLLGSPAGLACLGLGLLLIFAGLAWIDHIATTAAVR
jgi:tight adherence protein B